MRADFLNAECRSLRLRDPLGEAMIASAIEATRAGRTHYNWERSMKTRHLLLALTIAAIWGINFAVIDIGLREVPPLLLGALRFALVSVPAVLFVKRPATRWRNLVCYGWLTFAVQFALIFVAMRMGVSAGMTALVVQAQVVFTVALSALVMHEPVRTQHVIGGTVAAMGIVLVGRHIGTSLPWPGLLLVLAGALSWAGGNIVSKIIATRDLLGLVVWGSLFAWPELLGASYLMERSHWSLALIRHDTWSTLGALAYLAYPVTLFGYSAWSALLNRYPAASVTPFTLFVPVFALLASSLMLGEAMTIWKLQALLLVVGGVAILLYGETLIRKWCGILAKTLALAPSLWIVRDCKPPCPTGPWPRGLEAYSPIPASTFRVKLTFLVKFSNGGHLYGEDFLLDIEGTSISDERAAEIITSSMNLTRVGSVSLIAKTIVRRGEHAD